MKQTKQFLDDTMTRCKRCHQFMIEGKPHRCEAEDIGSYSYSEAPEPYRDDRDEPGYEVRQLGDEIPLGYPVIKTGRDWSGGK